jgi:hypothetical protein
MRHHSMRITLTATLALALAACQDGDDVSLGDDGDQQSLCGGAMDAEGQSDPNDPNCVPDQGLGIKWDGSECVAIAGCQCVGADCDRLYDSFDACQADCKQPCSSTDTPTPCPDGQFCMAPNFGCGAGYCTAVTDSNCSDTGPVCGCDGTTYDSMCAAMQSGVAPEAFTACGQ